MKYIAHRRFHENAICGPVNIPAMTELDCRNGVLICRSGIVCRADSNTGHRFFCRNDDGQGMERGRLTRAIMGALVRRDAHYQDRWDRIWQDPVCRPYRRADDEDWWLWNHEFFNADVEHLRHIARLVGTK